MCRHVGHGAAVNAVRTSRAPPIPPEKRATKALSPCTSSWAHFLAGLVTLHIAGSALPCHVVKPTACCGGCCRAPDGLTRRRREMSRCPTRRDGAFDATRPNPEPPRRTDRPVSTAALGDPGREFTDQEPTAPGRAPRRLSAVRNRVTSASKAPTKAASRAGPRKVRSLCRRGLMALEGGKDRPVQFVRR